MVWLSFTTLSWIPLYTRQIQTWMSLPYFYQKVKTSYKKYLLFICLIPRGTRTKLEWRFRTNLSASRLSSFCRVRTLSYGLFIIITPWSLAGILSDWKRIVWNYKNPHINAIKANFLAHFQATGMCAFCHHTERNWTQPRCLFTWLLQISTTLQL